MKKIPAEKNSVEKVPTANVQPKERKAVKIAEQKKRYLYETVLVGCPTCLSRFKVHGLASLTGKVARCPVCGQFVKIARSNSFVVSTEATDAVED